MSENSAIESVCSNSTTTTMEDPPLSAAASENIMSENSAVESLCSTTTRTRMVELAHPQAGGNCRDLGNLAELIDDASSLSLSLPMYRKTLISIHPLPINNNLHHHPWDLGGNFLLAHHHLIHAASSLPLKRKINASHTPCKKSENNWIQVDDDEGVIAKKHKVLDHKTPTGLALGNHHHHQWIHKRLSTSDVNLSSRLLLPKQDITKYVLPLMDMDTSTACQNSDGLRVKIWDLDTESEHQLTLKQWKTGCFLLTTNWNTEFVKRRSLQQGDTISMCWDFENLRFLFRKFNAQ